METIDLYEKNRKTSKHAHSVCLEASLNQIHSLLNFFFFFESRNKKYVAPIRKNKILDLNLKIVNRKLTTLLLKDSKSQNQKKILHLQTLNLPINHPWLKLKFCDHSRPIPKCSPTKAITATSKQPLLSVCVYIYNCLNYDRVSFGLNFKYLEALLFIYFSSKI